MKGISLLSFFLALSTIACVDRITIDVGSDSGFPVVVDGFISDQPGPYTVKLTRGFDIQSIYAQRLPISAKRLVISDDIGNRETLSPLSQGIYQTRADGIRGVVGRAYQLRIELLDGRMYESIPDTLLPAGNVERVYYQYTYEHTDSTAHYGFDVFADGSTGSRNNYHFLWKFTGTYQVDTNPELYDTLCVEARCPKPLRCSGYVVDSLGNLAKKNPC